MKDEVTQLAERFGGMAALAARLGVGITAPYNWRQRGIPWRLRERIREIADRDNVELPDSLRAKRDEAA